jgi:hypothetical protein
MPHIPDVPAIPAVPSLPEKTESRDDDKHRQLKIREQLSIQSHEPNPEKLILAMFGKEAKRDPATGLLVLPRSAGDAPGPRSG